MPVGKLDTFVIYLRSPVLQQLVCVEEMQTQSNENLHLQRMLLLQKPYHVIFTRLLVEYIFCLKGRTLVGRGRSLEVLVLHSGSWTRLA